MQVTTHRLTYEYGKKIRLKPIADVHLGNQACDVKAFKEFLQDSDESTLFIGIGDLLDSVIVKDKRYRKSSDATDGDSIVDEQIDRAEDLLSPYKNQILGLGDGNHEDTIIRIAGTNPIKRLCKRLDVPFLGFSGLFRLVFSEQKDNQRPSRGRTVIIRYHHGWGGGSRTQGADLTKYSKDIAYWQADIFLYGHVHKKQTDEIPRMGIVGDTLIAKDKQIAICGTFLKTYTKDTTYSEVKGYPPISVGGVCVEIRPDNKWVQMRSFTV